MNALIDATNARVLYVSPHVGVVTFLATAVHDTESELAVNIPNYPKGLPNLSFPIWKRTERQFVAAEAPDDALKTRAVFAARKAAAYAEMVAMIALARARSLSAFPHQDIVYAAKRREADRLLATETPGTKCPGEGDEIDPLESPYILQYAELESIAPIAAAREIALKARLADDVLLRSEYFRLKYCKLLRETESLGAVDAILLGFKRELYNRAA